MSLEEDVSPGQRANDSGRGMETLLISELEKRGCICTRQEYVGTSIYGTPLHADIVARGLPEYPEGLIIESKWQEVGGSVDEKYPYLVTNIKERYPCQTLVVLSGNGYRPGAGRWLRAQVGGNLIAVYSIDEFLAWLFRMKKRRLRNGR